METTELKTENKTENKNIKKIAVIAVIILLVVILAVNFVGGGAKGKAVKAFKNIIDEETALTSSLYTDFPFIQKLYSIKNGNSEADISFGILSANETAGALANKILEQMELGTNIRNDKSNNIASTGVSLYFKGSQILNFESYASEDTVTFDFPNILDDVYCIKNPEFLSEESDDKVRFENANGLVKSAAVANKASNAVSFDAEAGKKIASALVSALNKADYEKQENGSIAVTVKAEDIKNILAEAKNFADVEMLLKFFFEDEDVNLENITLSDGSMNLIFSEEGNLENADAQFDIVYVNAGGIERRMVFTAERNAENNLALSVLSDDSSEAGMVLSRSYVDGTYSMGAEVMLSDDEEEASYKLLLNLYKDKQEENAFVSVEYNLSDGADAKAGKKYEGYATVLANENSVNIDMPEGNVYALAGEKEIPVYKIEFTGDMSPLEESLEMPEAIDVKQLTDEQATALSTKILKGIAGSVLKAALSSSN